MFKKRYVLAALLALALNHPAEASAGYVNGWDLLEICKASPSSPLYRLKVAQCTSKLHRFNWSSTTPGTQSDLVKVTIDWLNNHPSLLNHKSDGLVAAALSEAFPCRLASQ